MPKLEMGLWLRVIFIRLERIPDGICKVMASIINFFWRDGRQNWISWKNMKARKLEGGMGIRNLSYFNQNLLAKQTPEIVHRPSAIHAQIFKARYFHHSLMLCADTGSALSPIRRSLI